MVNYWLIIFYNIKSIFILIMYMLSGDNKGVFKFVLNFIILILRIILVCLLWFLNNKVFLVNCLEYVMCLYVFFFL